jgi:Protein of unknown function (DUF1579)
MDMRAPTLVFAASMLAGASVWAQSPDDMKPAPELQAYKSMIGVWRCEGKMTMGGKEMKTTGQYRAAWDLDNRWVIAHFDGKAAGMPGSHKGLDLYGYDPVSKMYVSVGFDNFGGMMTSKSKGWEGDKEEWSGSGTMMGKSVDAKWTVTKKSDKEFLLAGNEGTDTWEADCKK